MCHLREIWLGILISWCRWCLRQVKCSDRRAKLRTCPKMVGDAQVKQATKMTGMLKSMMGKQPQWPTLPWHVTDAAAALPADHDQYARGEHTR